MCFDTEIGSLKLEKKEYEATLKHLLFLKDKVLYAALLVLCFFLEER